MDSKIRNLRQDLRFYEKAYQEGKPVITDEEYDVQLKLLEQLESGNPGLRTKDSPTRKLDPTEGKEQHLTPMLSLGKSHTWGDFIRFDRFIDKCVGEYQVYTYLLQPKLDGMAVSIQYHNGKIGKAITRGDGEYGVNVTEHIKKIDNIPKRLVNNYSLTIRGEVVISKENFAKLSGRPSNPRNTVAGLLNQKEPSKEIEYLDFIAHTFGDVAEEEPELNTVQAYEMYRNWGFDVIDSIKIKNIKHLRDEIDKQFKANEDNKYTCDGLVVRMSEYTMYYKIPDTQKLHRYAIALKPLPKVYDSVVTEINSSKGKTGRVTFVATIDPVIIDGVKVSKVNIYSEQKVKDLDIKVGSKVGVIRSGGVIPKIVRVTNEEK